MTEDTQKGHIRTDGRRQNVQSTPFEKFEDFVKKIAAVPKDELNEKLAEDERKKKERRAG